MENAFATAEARSLDPWQICLYAVPNLPLIRVGDDVAELVYDRAHAAGFSFGNGDVIVVTSKIVSKAEGATVRLGDVEPSARAHEIARATGRDARLCEVYLRESTEILAVKGSVVVTRHRLGFVCTSAGVDRSNVGPRDEEVVVLLPRDPDASARRIRERLRSLSGREVAVIIADSFGKPDRDGAIGVAIGIAGIRHLEAQERLDLFGFPQRVGINLVDELAGAGALLMGETDESRPVVVIRGVHYTRDGRASIHRLLMPPT